MSGPFKRRPSLKNLPPVGALQGLGGKGSSLRRQSSAGTALRPQPAAKELPWDMMDRCLLPVLFCQAAAVILSTVLNVLHISQVSTLTLFIWFTITVIGAVLFYHNLKVTSIGKAVLITGCDNRVGAALARYLDEQGFTVFAGFRQATESSFAEELKESCSARLHVLQLDSTSETQVLAASLYAVEHLPDGAPGLWAVVHADVYVPLGELEWIPPQVIRRATETNLLAPLRLSQVFLPLLRRARGRIVFITSVLGRASIPGRGLHCALLAALETGAESLRRELNRRHTDVVVVAPGELTAAGSWMDDQAMMRQAKEMWTQMCDEQKGEYGEEYFERAVRSVQKYTQQEVDLSPILRALNDAVIRTFPLPRYTPVTRQEKLQAFVADHFPRSVYDIIYS